MARKVLERNRARNQGATGAATGRNFGGDFEGEKLRLNCTENNRPDALELPSLTADDQADIEEAIEERAAIQEHDGELPRQEAEHEAEAAMRVYRFRLDYNPEQWLTMIAPGCDLEEATRTLRLRFGAGRVLNVLLQPKWRSSIKLDMEA